MSSLRSTESRKKRLGPNRLDGFGRSALHIAVSHGCLKDVQTALENGTNFNIQDLESGYTALHKCFLEGNLLLAIEILRKSPDLYLRDKEGYNCIDLLFSTIKTQSSSRFAKNLSKKELLNEMSEVAMYSFI